MVSKDKRYASLMPHHPVAALSAAIVGLFLERSEVTVGKSGIHGGCLCPKPPRPLILSKPAQDHGEVVEAGGDVGVVAVVQAPTHGKGLLVQLAGTLDLTQLAHTVSSSPLIVWLPVVLSSSSGVLHVTQSCDQGGSRGRGGTAGRLRSRFGTRDGEAGAAVDQWIAGVPHGWPGRRSSSTAGASQDEPVPLSPAG
jgi:hypothetical protein